MAERLQLCVVFVILLLPTLSHRDIEKLRFYDEEKTFSEFLMRQSRAKVKVPRRRNRSACHELEGLTTPFDYGEAMKKFPRSFY